jgi:hypothetical protein
MEIKVNKKNVDIVNSVLSNTNEIINKISHLQNIQQTDKKKLVLLDLLYRLYPNLNSISFLLNQYMELGNKGNVLPIGLIMRCCLEDMMFAKYLLSFQNNLGILENEISVQSKNFLSKYLKYFIENELEYWLCSPGKKAAAKVKNSQEYEKFKLDNKEFFDEQGKIRSINNLRKDVPGIKIYFNKESIKLNGPVQMYKQLKKSDFEFSYIYFEYKFYCLYEHYSFHTRKIMELNPFTFSHLTLSIEFVLSAMKDIFMFIEIDKSFVDGIIETKKQLGKLII